MDTERLSQLRKLAAEANQRAEKTTPGPWIADVRIGCIAVYQAPKENCLLEAHSWAVHYKRLESDLEERQPVIDTATFIAAARTDVPALAAAVEELAAECERLEAMQANLIRNAGAAQHECARLRGAMAECPVCRGKGGFYTFVDYRDGTGECLKATCPTCHGTGEVHEANEATNA